MAPRTDIDVRRPSVLRGYVAHGRPSKPRVGGSNPSGRAGFPSEAAEVASRNGSLQVASGPHPVPEIRAPKLNGRAALVSLDALAPALLERLRARVEAKITPEPTSGCWLWLGALSRAGYGNVGVAGSNRVAHRVVWLLERGPLAEGVELDHLCRNTACCNPGHLEPVSHIENVNRGLLGVLHTRCAHGHELTAPGARTTSGRCRRCYNADQAKWRAGRGVAA